MRTINVSARQSKSSTKQWKESNIWQLWQVDCGYVSQHLFNKERFPCRHETMTERPLPPFPKLHLPIIAASPCITVDLRHSDQLKLLWKEIFLMDLQIKFSLQISIIPLPSRFSGTCFRKSQHRAANVIISHVLGSAQETFSAIWPPSATMRHWWWLDRSGYAFWI